ncbi:uroporphyrinogen-III decarboxylase [Tessaracoccus sp. SD287]|uniref:uroporphyrinogen decarboxylase family protein n=1 Tax=Tessaracoccus sp. SD287 TaxID=2782008 RepID=UPI001A963838|nr:uroporphyrinogen decarboxylase family protein [Tessaracoccus sp. SD287]MBO1031501.1 uroporphyrinogen-III decarboxylase [Tessaracoccus sp. SD287]
MTWTPRERFAAVMAGELADRPPISAWRHHRDSEYPGGPLARWTADFAHRWQWDWVKLNPRATYYAEVWGNQYRTGDYEVRDIPRQTAVAITSLDDLAAVDARTDSPVLAEQVALVAEVHALAPDLPVVQTLFSPLSTLVQAAGLSYYAGKPVFGATGALTLPELFETDPALTHQALRAITDTYLSYLGDLRAAGMEGLFYAATGTLNPQITTSEQFSEFSEPYDLEILEEVADLSTIVHTCGEHSRAERLTRWGAAVSWDQFLPGNPSLADLDATVVVGGVDHRAFTEPVVIAEQAAAAATLGRVRPVLVTPTCSILSAQASDAGLAALTP